MGARSLREALLANHCNMQTLPISSAKEIRRALAPTASAVAAALAASASGAEGQELADAVGVELVVHALKDMLEVAEELGSTDFEVGAFGDMPVESECLAGP